MKTKLPGITQEQKDRVTLLKSRFRFELHRYQVSLVEDPKYGKTTLLPTLNRKYVKTTLGSTLYS